MEFTGICSCRRHSAGWLVVQCARDSAKRIVHAVILRRQWLVQVRCCSLQAPGAQVSAAPDSSRLQRRQQRLLAGASPAQAAALPGGGSEPRRGRVPPSLSGDEEPRPPHVAPALPAAALLGLLTRPRRETKRGLLVGTKPLQGWFLVWGVSARFQLLCQFLKPRGWKVGTHHPLCLWSHPTHVCVCVCVCVCVVGSTHPTRRMCAVQSVLYDLSCLCCCHLLCAPKTGIFACLLNTPCWSDHFNKKNLDQAEVVVQDRFALFSV